MSWVTLSIENKNLSTIGIWNINTAVSIQHNKTKTYQQLVFEIWIQWYQYNTTKQRLINNWYLKYQYNGINTTQQNKDLSTIGIYQYQYNNTTVNMRKFLGRNVKMVHHDLSVSFLFRDILYASRYDFLLNKEEIGLL